MFPCCQLFVLATLVYIVNGDFAIASSSGPSWSQVPSSYSVTGSYTALPTSLPPSFPLPSIIYSSPIPIGTPITLRVPIESSSNIEPPTVTTPTSATTDSSLPRSISSSQAVSSISSSQAVSSITSAVSSSSNDILSRPADSSTPTVSTGPSSTRISAPSSFSSMSTSSQSSTYSTTADTPSVSGSAELAVPHHSSKSQIAAVACGVSVGTLLILGLCYGGLRLYRNHKALRGTTFGNRAVSSAEPGRGGTTPFVARQEMSTAIHFEPDRKRQSGLGLAARSLTIHSHPPSSIEPAETVDVRSLNEPPTYHPRSRGMSSSAGYEDPPPSYHTSSDN
ncbi:hypothetical protein NM688_g3592 [Phlebia brevispora]|uniref:Uncharacterized protein n=1 Tax=Phlebia brevispora TaxID=194682 RepID=A0ACC1T5B2_9APHY|nr:hypothetical protein NM688_g3592 [Phlebia brevispora]